jgi:hypothetical protein
LDHRLLIAATDAGGHGPQMHGPILVVLLAIALVAGLVLLVRKRLRRKGSEHDRVNDRTSE